VVLLSCSPVVPLSCCLVVLWLRRPLFAPCLLHYAASAILLICVICTATAQIDRRLRLKFSCGKTYEFISVGSLKGVEGAVLWSRRFRFHDRYTPGTASCQLILRCGRPTRRFADSPIRRLKQWISRLRLRLAKVQCPLSDHILISLTNHRC
jgi:hypothetical protein